MMLGTSCPFRLELGNGGPSANRLSRPAGDGKPAAGVDVTADALGAGTDNRYRDDLFLWLDKAYEEHSMGLVGVSSVMWTPFHSDPRLIAFRKKLGLAP
jgi:hypothetical protein